MAELNLRTTALNAIKRIHDRIQGANFEVVDVSQLNQELKAITGHYDRFVHNHQQLVRNAQETELESHEQLREQVEAWYDKTCIKLDRKILECHQKNNPKHPDKAEASTSSAQKFDFKLDPVVIPMFDGSLHNWLAFKDTFQTLVDEMDFPEAYKLCKLRQTVNAIKVPLIGAMYSGGYKEVWLALKERYDNKKLLAEIHVSRFLNIKPAVDETAKALLSIVDTVHESFRALRVMELPVDEWGALAVPLIVAKLPSTTQREWSMSCSSNEIPHLSSLLEFLEKRAHSLTTEIISQPNRSQSSTARPHSQRRAHSSVNSNVATRDEEKCLHCQGPHRIGRCQNLMALRPEQRFDALKTSHLCFNCLKPGHSSSRCSSGGCRNCGRKHHTIFCRETNKQAPAGRNVEVPAQNFQQQPTSSNSSRLTDSITSCFAQESRPILLATARAYAYGQSVHQQHLARLLCDPGSQVSFISERFANHLHLRRHKYDIAVGGIGGFAHTQTKGSTTLTLRSIHSSFTLTIEVLVIPAITSILPAKPINVRRWKHLADLDLADPHFGTPGGIDVLIGADVWGLVVQGEVITGTRNEPNAQRTRLGWVVFGPASSGAPPPQSLNAAHARVNADGSLACNSCCSCATRAQLCADEPTLDKLIQNFWKLEEVPEHEAQDDECGRIFATTHCRTQDGRYMVRIPFRRDAPDLGESYTQALRHFQCLERRLASNNELREKYVTFMREYFALGHMEPCQLGDQKGCYYIPHHAVTTKFRVVFNASAPTSLGVSLNDAQLVGPTIQDSLINIIFRFRRFRVALTADIEKMFRQVLVAPADRNFQRILWRESPAEPISIFRLTTVTYGMACSPYNAVRALHQCAYDNYTCVLDQTRAVTARDAILTSFYVDDFLTSCNDANGAVTLASDVDAVLSLGHFKLRKWNSNDAQVIVNLTGGTSSSTELIIDSPTATVLGLRWDPVRDELFFSVSLESQPSCLTKRHVLSEVSKLFDPTGLVAPVVIVGKMFIQTLWVAGIKWDAPLPDKLCETWLHFRNGLDAINRVRVSRWLGMMNGETTELHGFCDASSRAYAAVIYTKTIDSNKNQRISLLTARTKVAPIKGATIPRLELCAAQLLAVTLENVRVALGLTNTPYFLWSDSQIVLCWLRKQPTTLKPYVSNRVRQIQELTSPEHWNYVRSAQNPADCASRGMGARELLKYRLWWHGPDWLMETPVPSSINEDVQLHQDELRVVREEEKVSMLSMVAAVRPMMTILATRRRDGEVIAFTEHFSSLSRLLHTVVRMLRWSPHRRHLWKLSISADELDAALDQLIRLEQATAFPSEIHSIQSGHRLPISSRLLPLNPFMDDSGILRVGGRLTKATASNDFRFPIILPRRSAFTWLLIQQAHQRTLHGGTQLMLHHLRTRYWILHARQAVRSFIHRCVICRRSRGATLTQQMASLPKGRVNATRPFLSAGVDYCGPFNLRIGTKRSRTTVKTYLAIFVCMATKAVHIEVVEDLSSQAFLDAYTRFVSRRGLCRDLHSDNGTAFVGADRILQDDLAAWHSDYTQQALADVGTNWHFITPSAPHQGGLWEAAVKSAKRHLVRLVGGQAMWYHQLHTLAARIEACLNSRPLVPLHDDPDDKFALSPGDFLIGAPLLAIPEPRIDKVPANRISQWQWLRQIHQHFWQRWSEEYLVTLQTRSKWQRREDNIQVGDVVLIRQDNLPPTHWRLGRVTEVHPGSDGLIRNATVKTAAGVCTRAVQKLCRLLVSEDVKADAQIEPDGSTGQDV